jgi:RNA polymerase sigma-70 factor (ECF subfamily)
MRLPWQNAASISNGPSPKLHVPLRSACLFLNFLKSHQRNACRYVVIFDGWTVTKVPENYPSGNNLDGHGTLVVEYWSAVYGYMFRLCGNIHDAEELTQDAFLRAFQKIHQFQPGTNMRGWLLRIATNAFLDQKRRQHGEQLPLVLDEVPSSQLAADVLWERNELAQKVQLALLQLSTTQRAVFVLRTIEDLPFCDIADTLGTTETTARWHMLQARQRLLELVGGAL